MPKPAPRSPLFKKLLAHALAMPGAWEDHPWGESVAKCSSGKVFVFFGVPKDGQFLMAVKLPVSGTKALLRNDCEPTNYGMGKHGWVTLTAPPSTKFPAGLLERWIEESWCAVAPKKDVTQWMGVAAEPVAKTKSKRTPKSKR